MNGERHIERILLIDADDTLWECNIFYAECTRLFGEQMTALGFDRDIARRFQKEAELAVIPEYGYAPAGYVRSLEMTYEHLTQRAGVSLDPVELAKISDHAQLVLNPNMILMASIEQTLKALRPSSKLVLVTKGDQAFQQEKIDVSGLSPLFDAEYIVPEKHDETYRRVAREQGIQNMCTWMIGNSPRSDINPAVRAGLGAIYIPHPASWSAELEPIEEPERVVTLDRFADLTAYFLQDTRA